MGPIERLAHSIARPSPAAGFGAIRVRRLACVVCVLSLTGSVGLGIGGCGSSSQRAEWYEDGYANAFLAGTGSGEAKSDLVLRVKKGEKAWYEASRLGIGSGSFRGVGLAQRPRHTSTLLGYTLGHILKIHQGLGLAFGSRPGNELRGVATGPALVHTTGSSWLVAYTLTQGRGIQVRPFYSGRTSRFGPPLDLSGIARNDHVAGRPAIAYVDGRLVLVWGRVAGNRAFRYLAADFDPGTNAVEIVGQGDVPRPQSYYVTEFKSSPALARDSRGSLYLAAVYRSGLTGLTYDTIKVYSSSGGTTWRSIGASFPGGTRFHTGQTHVGLAARLRPEDGASPPAGDNAAPSFGTELSLTPLELLLTVTAGESVPGRTLSFSNIGGAWVNLGNRAFGARPAYYYDFSTIGWSYLED